MARILVILNPGAEEIETLTVPDILVRAGQDVLIAASSSVPVVTGSRGLPLAAHTCLDHIRSQTFDIIYLPGGIGSAEINRSDGRIQDMIQAQLDSGRILAVICASPIALVPRKLCAGHQVTCYPGLRDQVEPHAAAWCDQAVVQSRNLVTSQGPATALALGLHLATMVAGAETTRKVAAALLVPA